MQDVVLQCHEILEKCLTKESIVIDATAGNGKDTLFLSRIAKYVYAFDIQEFAIKNTTELLKLNNVSNVNLILDSHENIDNHVKCCVDAVVFNFGYLPSFDKSITTQASSSIVAIKESLLLLNEGGIITMTLYIGHDEGKIEAVEIEEFLKLLSGKIYTVTKYQTLNRVDAPYNIVIYKKELNTLR